MALHADPDDQKRERDATLMSNKNKPSWEFIERENVNDKAVFRSGGIVVFYTHVMWVMVVASCTAEQTNALYDNMHMFSNTSVRAKVVSTLADIW